MDIAPERLQTARWLAESIRSGLGVGAQIEYTTERRQALDGADFVICTIGVGGSKATLRDHEIPARFGIRQTVGDTLPMATHCLAVARVTRINHMAFFLRFESAGTDLYPAFRQMLGLPHMRRLDPVRFELFERLGYFMTETSGHTAEYVPYFLRDAAETERMHLEVSSYVDTCRRQDDAYKAMATALAAGAEVVRRPYELSVEYASRIINAIVTGVPYIFNGNVHNDGGRVIPNLPRDCCVEVPCTADGTGIRPGFAEELPPQCAALIRRVPIRGERPMAAGVSLE